MRLATAVLAVLACLAARSRADWAFPTYKQCDPRWGGNEMGVAGPGERATICQEGCAMSSVSMALAGLGVTLDGAPVTPASMNSWLESHGGYTCIDGDCNNLVLSAPDSVPGSPLCLRGESPKPSLRDLRLAVMARDTIFIGA